FFFSSPPTYVLPSFPTRRSSDLIERADDVFGLNLGLAVVQLDNNTRHTALPEWNQHPAAHGGLYPVCDAIGERHVQRDGQGNVRSEEHTSELQSPYDLVWRLLLE